MACSSGEHDNVARHYLEDTSDFTAEPYGSGSTGDPENFVCVTVVMRESIDADSPGVCPSVGVESLFDGDSTVSRHIGERTFVNDHRPGRVIRDGAVVGQEVMGYIGHRISD